MKSYENFILETIIEKCEPFIQLLQSCKDKRLIYHSTSDIFSKTKIIKRRDRETPKDLNINLHEYVGELLKNKFGYNPRKESLFCHNLNLEDMEEYGDPFIVFPIGTFKYIWSTDYNDLYLSLWKKYKIPYWNKIPKKEEINMNILYNKVYIDIYNDCEKYVESCINTNFCDFLKGNHEIMIWSESYLLIDFDYQDYIKEKIWK